MRGERFFCSKCQISASVFGRETIKTCPKCSSKMIDLSGREGTCDECSAVVKKGQKWCDSCKATRDHG